MIDRSIKLVPTLTITAAVTSIASQVVPIPAVVDQMTLHCNFVYGSGGTTAKAFLQTSLDNGSTWVDIACFAFGVASARKVMSLQFQSSVVAALTVTDGSLADDTAKDGVLGDRLRVKLITVGTYAGGTTIELRAMIN